MREKNRIPGVSLRWNETWPMYKCTVAKFEGISISLAGLPLTTGWLINSVVIPEQQHLRTVPTN